MPSQKALLEQQQAFVAGLHARGLGGVKVGGDGNCLYRATALTILHSEDRHLEVRDNVLSQLTANRAHYQLIGHLTDADYVAMLADVNQVCAGVNVLVSIGVAVCASLSNVHHSRHQI
jgi:hypothetical protein